MNGVLVVPGMPDIAVTNEQIVEFELEDEGSEVELEEGVLETEARNSTGNRRTRRH